MKKNLWVKAIKKFKGKMIEIGQKGVAPAINPLARPRLMKLLDVDEECVYAEQDWPPKGTVVPAEEAGLFRVVIPRSEITHVSCKVEE